MTRPPISTAQVRKQTLCWRLVAVVREFNRIAEFKKPSEHSKATQSQRSVKGRAKKKGVALLQSKETARVNKGDQCIALPLSGI